MRKIIILTTVLLIIFSCSKGPAKKNSGTGEKINPEVVEVKTIKFEKFAEYIRFSARPEGITDIVLTSRVSGMIKNVHKGIGDSIVKGEEIGMIDNRDYLIRLKQSKASLKAAEAGLDVAEVELKAAKSLYEKGKISDTEMLRTRSSYKTSLAGVEAAKAGVEQNQKAYNDTRFISPVSGKITEINIETGENIFSGSPVCSIVDASKLRIKTGIGESDISKLSKGMAVTVMRPGLSEPITGEITGIGMKPGSGSVNYPVEIVFPNPGGFVYPGMTVNCLIETNSDENAIVISPDNIIKEYDTEYVYTVEEGKALKTKIITGKKSGNRIMVLSGIKPGDKLIFSGMENITDGKPVRIREK